MPEPKDALPPALPPHAAPPPLQERGAGLLALVALCRFLRSPEGCPWDRKQTLASLTPYMVEETYEILDSVTEGDRNAVTEELGDLLFLLFFCAEMVRDGGGPDLDALARRTEAKLVQRHPNLFAEPETISAVDQHRRWQRLKQAEQGTSTVLGKQPKGIPSLVAAYRTQEKAASVGFDWEKVEDVVAKIEEELSEVRREIAARAAAPEALGREIGDLLFAVANLARFLRVDPERELRATVQRFRLRFQFIEEKLAARGSSPEKSTLAEMDALWNEAKRTEGKEEAGERPR
jgi:MazG family protein